MALAMNFYRDQLGAGASAAPLPAAHRVLYVRQGQVAIGGAMLGPGEAIYSDAAVSPAAEAWSEILRWELASPDRPPVSLDGGEVHSSLRLSRVLTMLDVTPGSRWVMRLDEIVTPAGRVADRHQHPGPGIRCLLEGTFNVEQAAESRRELLPGDAWWETGSDTVVAWGSARMATRFARVLLLAPEWEGKRTGQWLASRPGVAPDRGGWTLHFDRIVTV